MVNHPNRSKATETARALLELYCACGPMSDPVVADWWERMGEDAASHDDFHRDSAWYRREAQARAREELTRLGLYRDQGKD